MYITLCEHINKINMFTEEQFYFWSKSTTNTIYEL